MEFFDTFPFTMLQGKNRGLDWVVQKIKEFQKAIDKIPETVKQNIDKSNTSHAANKNNPHNVTAAQTGARPNTWLPTISEIGAAPAGHGLGLESPKRVGSADNATSNGWYIVDDIFGAGTGWLYCASYSNDYKYQEFYNIHGDTYIHLERWMDVNGWREWEWIDPLMALGVEYLTTERCVGKPVYAKRVSYTISESIGSTSGVTTISIPHGISGFTGLVHCTGSTTNGYLLPFLETSGGITTVNGVDGTNINIRISNATWTQGRTFEFELYYTK